MPCTTHTIRIPDWNPTLLNKLLGSHWARAARLKEMDKEIVSVMAYRQSVPKVKLVRGPDRIEGGKVYPGRLRKGTGPRRRVSLLIQLEAGQRRGDRDGYWKSVLDALVACQRLVNDSPVWCEQGPVEFERTGRIGTIITLEDLA